jgi:hypothetical protein
MPDINGLLSADEKNKIIAWLTSFSRPIPICPICGDGNWSVGDHILTGQIYRPGFIIGPGTSYPSIMVISPKCGYTMHINAVLAGILPASGG